MSILRSGSEGDGKDKASSSHGGKHKCHDPGQLVILPDSGGLGVNQMKRRCGELKDFHRLI